MSRSLDSDKIMYKTGRRFYTQEWGELVTGGEVRKGMKVIMIIMILEIQGCPRDSFHFHLISFLLFTHAQCVRCMIVTDTCINILELVSLQHTWNVGAATYVHMHSDRTLLDTHTFPFNSWVFRVTMPAPLHRITKASTNRIPPSPVALLLPYWRSLNMIAQHMERV